METDTSLSPWLFFQIKINNLIVHVFYSLCSWRKVRGDWERSFMVLLKLTRLYYSCDAMGTTIVWLQCVSP